ncbi:claw keratin-like [Stomoxys calcitrans]|uniref:Uncharacterized protein n=1 Tax=Stomoxys calcitrans TaxID=35570 RepID=A0A1I8QCZ5_STOCA|nr:claw keratin-like [Stomoxys calcitrans]
MKFLSAGLIVIGCLLAHISAAPLESTTHQPETQQAPLQVAVPLPEIIHDHEPIANPSEQVLTVVPVTLLDVEPVVEATGTATDDSTVRNARGLGGLGLGKFGGLGLGFKGGFGGFGGLGGLHGFGGGLHGFGFKPMFFKHFG